jgi:uncharacterized protein
MGRFIFFLLLAVAAYIGWRWLRASTDRAAPSRTDKVPAPQAMVSCAHCGLHLPRLDALPAGDRFFCCEEHRQRGSSS